MLALTGSVDKAGLGMALDSRKRIGQAQGILMERYGLDEARAFEVLRRYSQDHNIKLRYVAEHLITAGQLPTPPHVDNEPADTGQSGWGRRALAKLSLHRPRQQPKPGLPIQIPAWCPWRATRLRGSSLRVRLGCMSGACLGTSATRRMERP